MRTVRTKAAIALAAIAFLLLGFLGFRYWSRQTLIAEANRTATPLTDIKEKITPDALGQYFAGVSGSFVLFDRNKNEWSIYNEKDSQKRVSPCSTFKILNSLIGLETGVVQDENTLFKWDGIRYQIPAWNGDHTLASAFSASVVWYYQRLASGVGKERMQRFLDETHYGNANLSGGLTTFWLDSSLRISPLEQVLFLREFYASELPFSPKNIDTVKRIMVLARGNGSVLSGKTGFAGGHLAWFVGYLETDDNVLFFATKVEGKGLQTNVARILTEEILKHKKLLN